MDREILLRQRPVNAIRRPNRRPSVQVLPRPPPPRRRASVSIRRPNLNEFIGQLEQERNEIVAPLRRSSFYSRGRRPSIQHPTNDNPLSQNIEPNPNIEHGNLNNFF